MVRSLRILSVLILCAIALSACNSRKGTIVPSLQINKKSAEMGTPIEVTYTFSTKKDYVPLSKDMTVFVHFLDPRENIRFQDDHLPPIQTSQWRPNGNYHYTRTVFIPRNIPAGEYDVVVGIYQPKKEERVQMDAAQRGNRSYDVGKLLIEIPPQEPIIQWAKGWHDPENEPNNPAIHWRWTKKEAVMKVRNPQSDALLYLKADAVPERFTDGPQNITVKVGDNVVETFAVTGNQPFMKKYPVEKSKLGNQKMVEIKLELDKTFIPAEDKVSSDTRELGIRVYELYLGKAQD